MNALRVDLYFHDDATVIVVAGELDLITAEQFAEALRLTSDPVIVDMTELGFIDSTGLAVLAYAWREGRDVRIRGAEGTVKRAFEICGFGDRLGTL